MDTLLAARMQMAFSLGFHIIFACIGMVMPFFMAFAEWKWLRTQSPVYLDLAKAWSKGVAIFFAVGAVTGTMLSFELGLLFPTFMEHAGPIIGMPFSWEGTAFFIEAIALGIFLYGWDKVPPWIHWLSGLIVGLAGLASGLLVIAANGWMNSPTGFLYENGVFSQIDPVAAMFNDAWFSQVHHMMLATFVSVGFAVAGIHALLILRGQRSLFHRTALQIALSFGTIAAILIPISGDASAKDVAIRQPAKLAAMEAHFHTEAAAPFLIGGIPDETTETVSYGIKIPYLLSFLAHGDPHAVVKGLDQFPTDERPPVLVVHLAFQIMIAIGTFLMLLSLLFWWLRWRKSSWLQRDVWLKLLVACTPLGFIALEAGWTVTEVGRQPWIIYNIMKTKDAVTPMPGMAYSFYFTMLIFVVLSIILLGLMRRQFASVPKRYESGKIELDSNH